MDRLFAALPAIGAVVGYLLYFPYLWIFEEYRENVRFEVDTYKTIKRTFDTYEMSDEPVVDVAGNRFEVPLCNISEAPTVSSPAVDEHGELIAGRTDRFYSGWGQPTQTINGTTVLFAKNYVLRCVPVVQTLPGAIDPTTGIPKGTTGLVQTVDSEFVLEVIGEREVGRVLETDVHFRTSFGPQDLIQASALIGAWLSLIALIYEKRTRKT